MLHELGFELRTGDPAEFRTKGVRKQKTDRQDASLLLRLLMCPSVTRPHSGKYSYGKTPLQTFLDSVPLALGVGEWEKMLDRNFPSAPEPERSAAQRSAGGGATAHTTA